MAPEDSSIWQEEMTVGAQKEDRGQLSDPEIADLVSGLDNLHWNLQVQADILGLGARGAGISELPARTTQPVPRGKGARG